MKKKITIVTAVKGLILIELHLDDSKEYFKLVNNNRQHLTQYGDYQEYSNPTYESIKKQLTNSESSNAKFGIWLHNTLIGRVDLAPRKKGDFVLGYWLGNDYTGNGYATAACVALINCGKENFGAKIVYAGVSKGNLKSEALLKRLKFEKTNDMGTYTLFRHVICN